MSTLDDLRKLDTGSFSAPGVEKFIGCRIGPGYVRFLVADLDLDTDGADHPSVKRWEKYHQGQTSYDEAGKVICSVTSPYVVLPKWVADDLGIELGTLCAILDPDNVAVFAMLADYGPKRKIGEASIAVHLALGKHPVRANGTIRDASLGWNVRLVFLTGAKLPNTATFEQIQSVGRDALAAVLGDKCK